MKISRGPVWCSVEGSKREHRWLERELSIRLEGFVRGRWRRWKRCLYNIKTKHFPAGLLPMVISDGGRRLENIQVRDLREIPAQVLPLPPEGSFLWEHQVSAIDAAIDAGHGILKLPTGAGKTMLAIFLAYRLNCQTLFLVDEKSLLMQTAEAYENAIGRPAGVIGDGEFSPSDFTVATVQTLYRRRKERRVRRFLQGIGCVIGDEVHIAGSDTYFKVAMLCPAYWRFGLSATPTGRSDRLDIFVVAAFGPIIYSITLADLAYCTNNKIVPPHIVFYDYPRGDDVSCSGWHNIYREGVVEYQERNRAVARAAKLAPKPALIFFDRIGHGRELAKMLERRGINAEIVHGAFGAKERRNLIKRLNSGDIDVLLASKVFNKGVDIPRIRSCINAGGMKAQITTIQKLGRGLRKTGSKDGVVFVDFVDRHHELLIKHSRERARTYTAEELDLRVFRQIEEGIEWAKRKRGLKRSRSSR